MRTLIKNPLLNYTLKNQTSYLILDAHTKSPILNYTFLQSNLQLLPSSILPDLNSYGLMPGTARAVERYLGAVEKLEDKLVGIRDEDIQPTVLADQDVRGLAGLFGEMKGCMGQEAIRCIEGVSRNSEGLASLAISCNALQMPLWNRILMAGCQNYKHTSPENRLTLMSSLLAYLNKYCYTSFQTFKPYKFIMRETHSQDIIDFSYLLKSTENSHSPSPSQSFTSSLELLKTRIQVIQKLSKSLNLNFYDLRHEFLGLKGELINNMDFMEVEELIFVYSFYAKISACQADFVKEVQGVLLRRLESGATRSVFAREGLCKDILNVWKEQSRYDPKLWNRVLQPFLTDRLEKLDSLDQKPQMFSLWSSIAYSMICCGLTDTGLPSKILGKFHKASSKNNRTVRITTEYLTHKAQPPKTPKSLHSLLTRSSPRSPSLSPSAPAQQAIEFNPVQQFWYTIIRSLIPDQDIHRSQYISMFQVDMLVQYKGKFFAFEVQGSHYRFDRSQSGKKKIKEEILRCFGVRTIAIRCEEIQAKLIMRLKLAKDGKAYIKKLLQAEFEQAKTEPKSQSTHSH